MKDKLNELKWLPTKGDPLNQVKTHNIIIDNLSELDENDLKYEIVTLRNQLNDIIKTLNIDLNG